jgi:hypothetical protein
LDSDSDFDSEHSESESSSRSDCERASNSESEASNSDSAGEGTELRYQSMGRRSAAPRRTEPDDDHLSVSASVLEAKTLLGSAGTAGDIMRPPLSIRTSDQARKLVNYLEHATLNDAQWARCMAEFVVFAQKGGVESNRPWFITQQNAKPYMAPRKPRKQHQLAPSGAGVGLLARSDSVVSSRGAADGVAPMDLGEDVLDSASTAASRATTNRWREREHLQHDYAEYRSCCGQPTRWAPQFRAVGLAGAKAMADHCSHSVHAFFKARLENRYECTDRKSYDHMVMRELLHAKPKWTGYDVCCSCFRAALGIGRDAVFRMSRLKVSDALEAVPELTKSGTLRKKRAAKQRDRAVALLRSFCHVYGQSAPNPSSADPTRRRFIVPQKQMFELTSALLAFDQQTRALSSPEPLTASAIYRGIDWLEVYENLFISLGKGNSLCRCAVCDKLDNQCTSAYVKEHKLLPKDVLRFKAQKLSHLAQMREQREYFDSHKDEAMRQPLNEWCITFDGMDQSKTQLPSRARFSKDLEPLARLKLHWIGAFCFGGPDPVFGLMNTPELRKDAALSVVTLERILDSQWLELERLHHAGVRVAATGSRAASQANEENKMEEEHEHGDASTLDSSAAAYSGPGMKWPKRLHVTFDNASGECKNQWMMRFLGLLVFHGVFQAITASMLLVGHTHDIVDQMFSVWSRMLRIYNAETYEKMKALFRERYHSRIDGLVDLMKGQKEAYNALTKEEREAWDDEIKEAGVDWSGEQADILADFSAFVKEHNMLRPHIAQQTVTVDVEGWLRRAVAAKHPPSLQGLSKAYNFGVEKHTDGNVYLFNSQFANSADRPMDKAIIHYRGQLTGNWTTRALLYLASDPGLARDPYRTPPLTIDLAPLRATVLKYVEHKAMSALERDQFNAMLDRLDEGQAKQRADCATCYEALMSFGRHGVVSQRKKATDEEKAQATQKLSARSKAWTALQTHLRDPAFADVHQAKMVHTGFWTKWLQRQQEHIQPAYIERGYMFNPTDLAEPYHAAETELCSGVGEPPVHSDRAARIDLTYLHRQGVPVEGQVAIQRTGVSREPFFLCKIVATRPSQKLQSRQIAAISEAQKSQGAAAADSEHAAAAATEPAGVPERAHAQPTRLKDFEFQVMYYDFCTEDFEKLHLSSEDHTAAKKAADAKWWKDQYSQQQQTEAELTAAMEHATANRKPAPARPSWLVNLFSDARFLFDNKTTVSDWISGATLIAWGANTELLKAASKSRGHSTWQLKAPVWRQLHEDLTERKQDTACEAPGATAKHSKIQARSRKKKHDESDQDDDSDEAVNAEGAAASAAVPARPRLSRATHATAPIVELSEDDEELEDDREEDQEEASSAADEPDDVDMFSIATSDAMPLSALLQANNNGPKQKTTNEPAAQARRPRKRKQKVAAAAAASTRRRVGTGRKKKA